MADRIEATELCGVNVHACGWERDLPDHRDFTPSHAKITAWLRKLKPPKKGHTRPGTVDLRLYCAPIEHQQGLATSSAHACAALLQYFVRRAHGEALAPSRLFLHANARRLALRTGSGGGSLRETLKALVRFGAPPEQFWPYDAALAEQMPDAFAYGFRAEFSGIRYLRLDARQQSGSRTLELVLSFLAAGIPCTVGFPVNSGVSRAAELAFPTVYDTILSGHALCAVGYDDRMRIRSDRGALLVRNSWGAEWGEAGYGWLPYSFIREGLAADMWTMLKPDWLESGEFHRPE